MRISRFLRGVLIGATAAVLIPYATSVYKSGRYEGSNAYYEKFDRSLKEFRLSTVPRFTSTPTPAELRSENVEDSSNAIDLNGDGKPEYVIEGRRAACGSGGCSASVYEERDGRYVKILDTGIWRVSNGPGFKDVFDSAKVYLPSGGFTMMQMKFSWDDNRQRYVKSGEILEPEYAKMIARDINDMFQTTTDPFERSTMIKELGKRIGTHYALEALLESQARLPSGVPMPADGEKRERFLRQLSEDTHFPWINYRDNPEGFERAFFGAATSPYMLRPYSPQSAVALVGLFTARNIAKELHQDAYSRYVDEWRKVDPTVAAWMRQTGAQPNPQKLDEIFWKGGAMAIDEREMPKRTQPRQSITNTYTDRYGTTVSKTQVYPFATPQQIEQIERQQQSGQDTQRFRSDVDRISPQIRPFVGQGIERGQQGINQLRHEVGGFIDSLKQPPKQQK